MEEPKSAAPQTGECIMKYQMVKFLAKLGIIVLLLVSTVTGLLLSGCSQEDKPEVTARQHTGGSDSTAKVEVKFTYTPAVYGADGKDTAPKMTFSKQGKVLLSIGAKVQNLCFVEEVWADKKSNKRRLTFTPYNFDSKDFDWRTKLLDLKGDGDSRYLIIADYHTGSSSEDMKGYVIDVKDNFKQIATIPVGEAFDLPYHNPKLIISGNTIFDFALQ